MAQIFSSLLAQRYAFSFIDLAEEAGALDSVEKDMIALQVMLADCADLGIVFTSQVIDKTQRIAALAAVADKAKFHGLTKNFLGVLAQNGRAQSISDVIHAFFADVAARRGEVTANVQVAQDMSAKQMKALSEALAKSIGKKVNIKLSVEPDLMGGMVVSVGSFMVDNSVKRKLERLKIAMSGQGANENLNQRVKEA